MADPSSKDRLKCLIDKCNNRDNRKTAMNVIEQGRLFDPPCRFCRLEGLPCIKMSPKRRCAFCAAKGRSAHTCEGVQQSSRKRGNSQVDSPAQQGQRATFRVTLPDTVQGRDQVSVSRTPEVSQAPVPKPPKATQAPEIPRAQEVVQTPASGTQEVVQSAGAPRAGELPHALEIPQTQGTREVLKNSQAQMAPKAPMRSTATQILKGLPLRRPQQHSNRAPTPTPSRSPSREDTRSPTPAPSETPAPPPLSQELPTIATMETVQQATQIPAPATARAAAEALENPEQPQLTSTTMITTTAPNAIEPRSTHPPPSPAVEGEAEAPASPKLRFLRHKLLRPKPLPRLPELTPATLLELQTTLNAQFLTLHNELSNLQHEIKNLSPLGEEMKTLGAKVDKMHDEQKLERERGRGGEREREREREREQEKEREKGPDGKGEKRKGGKPEIKGMFGNVENVFL